MQCYGVAQVLASYFVGAFKYQFTTKRNYFRKSLTHDAFVIIVAMDKDLYQVFISATIL